MDSNQRFLLKAFRKYYRENTPILPDRFTRREFGFMFFDKTYVQRHMGFSSPQELHLFMKGQVPSHSYYSTAYYRRPDAPTMEEKTWLGADLIFDLDADHLDIYGTPENYREAFRNFVAQCSDTLLIKRGLPLSEKDTPAKILTYSLDDPLSDYHAENIHPDSMGHFHYDLVHPGGVVKGIRVGTLGRVGAENSIAAAALALREGVDEGSLKEGISSFLGAERRMEVHINRPGLTYIDDYAHHPDELRATLSSIRGIFPGRKITAIFQPHLFSRTRDLSEGFADALSLADEVILLDIYPAREEPIPGVTSDIILRGITCPRKTLIHKEQLLSFLGNESEDVLVSFGAGDISSYVEPITSMLEKKYPSA